MLFNRVIAKSHEEITDDAILELDNPNLQKEDSEGSGSRSDSPSKNDNAHGKKRLQEL